MCVRTELSWFQVVQEAEAVSAERAASLVEGIGEGRTAGAAAWLPARGGRNNKADRALESLGTRCDLHRPHAHVWARDSGFSMDASTATACTPPNGDSSDGDSSGTLVTA